MERMTEVFVSPLVVAARAFSRLADQGAVSDFTSEREDVTSPEGEESHDGDPPPA